MAKHNPERTSSDGAHRLESNRRTTRGGSPFAALLKSPFRLLNEGNSTTIAILLFALVVWAFFPSVHNGFVSFDDPLYIHPRVRVQEGLTWANVRWAFTSLDAGFWHPTAR